MDLNILSEEELVRLDDLIRSSEQIVITGHSRPDGDALGACLGWAEYLRVHYRKEPKVIMPNGFPDFLHWLPLNER
ncbi:MAG: bifunctional oligoribonuclease/PAP phosphatase NrnA, partial [Prevotella sp.]|nr:bifunctional oligoribonuclease/PAP phosphatase NrnA [Prevotella sp.]